MPDERRPYHMRSLAAVSVTRRKTCAPKLPAIECAALASLIDNVAAVRNLRTHAQQSMKPACAQLHRKTHLHVWTRDVHLLTTKHSVLLAIKGYFNKHCRTNNHDESIDSVIIILHL